MDRWQLLNIGLSYFFCISYVIIISESMCLINILCISRTVIFTSSTTQTAYRLMTVLTAGSSSHPLKLGKCFEKKSYFIYNEKSLGPLLQK